MHAEQCLRGRLAGSYWHRSTRWFHDKDFCFNKERRSSGEELHWRWSGKCDLVSSVDFSMGQCRKSWLLVAGPVQNCVQNSRVMNCSLWKTTTASVLLMVSYFKLSLKKKLKISKTKASNDLVRKSFSRNIINKYYPETKVTQVRMAVQRSSTLSRFRVLLIEKRKQVQNWISKKRSSL